MSGMKLEIGELFSVELARSAVFTPDPGAPATTVPCLVVLEHDVILQPSSYDARVVETGSTIMALFSDVGEPAAGSIFEVDGDIFRVARITDNNRIFVTMAVIDD